MILEIHDNISTSPLKYNIAESLEYSLLPNLAIIHFPNSFDTLK